MAVAESEPTLSLENVLDRIRPAVRARHPYIVGGKENPPVKLNQNESPYDFPAEIKDEILAAFREIPFNRYPEEQPTRLVRAYADHVGIPAESVLVGNGSNELTYTLGLTLIDPGSPVVLPRPMFSLYEKVVRLHDGRLIEIPPRSDFSFDEEALLDAVRREDPVLTVLTTPNNPTGLAMTHEAVEAIVAAASGFVVVDEAYVEFTDEESAIDLLGTYPNLILLRTLSKACGMAGLRIGFMLAHPAVIREIMKARLPFMIDRLAETAAITMLRYPDLLAGRAKELRASREVLAAGLRELGLEILPSQSNFVLFRTEVEPAALMGRLAESGIVVRDMSGYAELRGFLRVNAGTERENNAFLVALKNALSGSR